MTVTLDDVRSAPDSAADVYRRYGAVLCPGLVPAEYLARLRGRVQDIIDMQARLAGLDRRGLDITELQAERPDYVPGVYDMVNSHPELHRLAGADELCEVADSLINGNGARELVVSGLQLRMDLPNNRSELLGWHRDHDYFPHLPKQGVVLWIPLHDIDEENGGISFVPAPAEHLQSVAVHRSWPGRRKPQRLFEIDDAEAALESLPAPVRVTCKAGDALFFSLWNPHRSEPNRSQAARWTLQYRYFSASEAVTDKLDRATLEAQRTAST
jgi:ectoine hydroxylase-related dioxygenase (phytanoyl-CoA dioxygenase family)